MYKTSQQSVKASIFDYEPLIRWWLGGQPNDTIQSQWEETSKTNENHESEINMDKDLVTIWLPESELVVVDLRRKVMFRKLQRDERGGWIEVSFVYAFDVN